MKRNEALVLLNMIKRQFEKMKECEDYAEAMEIAIADVGEKERHRRSWEEILAEERT